MQCIKSLEASGFTFTPTGGLAARIEISFDSEFLMHPQNMQGPSIPLWRPCNLVDFGTESIAKS